MKKNNLSLLFLSSLLLLASCSEIKDTLGLTKEIPDEFEIAHHKPLEIPSGKGTLVDTCGCKTSDPLSLKQIVLGKKEEKKVSKSKAEEQFLSKLKLESVQGIREQVNDEASVRPTGAKAFQEKARNVIMFWKRDDKKKPAKIIRADEEKKRLEKDGIST